METSRDDFVIAIRSAFLKKETQQRFSLLGLIFFSIIFLFLGTLNFKIIDYVKIGIKEVVYRSSFIISGPEELIKKNYIFINNHLNLYNENKKNKLELEILRSKDLLNNFIILENKRLKVIIEDYLVNSDEIIAKVLIDKQSPFLKSLVINKGSKHNIELGMAVLDRNYLVGKVVEVNYVSSRILLLSDINSKIPVVIEPGNIQSILSGTGKNYGKIQYFRKNSKIEEDSIVYTSGFADLFKAGIPVGKIIESEEKNSTDKHTVDFFADFSQLNFVEITSFKKREE
jgi:rod shape-determining protein MreC